MIRFIRLVQSRKIIERGTAPALQYSQYIRWKIEDDDAALAEQMTGYPAEQDAFHLESLEEQKKVWFCGIGKETFVALQNGSAGSGQPVELALELDRPEWYTAYLSMESAAFFETYFRKNQIPDPPIFHPDRLYIGNSFCPHLAPKEEELFAMMDKACRESFAVTLVFLLAGEICRKHKSVYTILPDGVSKRTKPLSLL